LPKSLKVSDISHPVEQLAQVRPDELMPLPPPYDKIEEQPGWKEISPAQRQKYEASLDGVVAVGVPIPATAEEEDRLVEGFLSGLKKLLTKENNWTFLQQLMLSIDHCARCQNCIETCPIYVSSGYNDIYRPTFRSDLFRRLVSKYIKPGGKYFGELKQGAIELNWRTVSRLLELAYRCTLCRRCAHACPIGLGNALITHELRKLFSMEFGYSPKEIHDKGSMLQLKVGSSTGMNRLAVMDNVEFIDEDMSDLTGLSVKSVWDKEGADVLLIHNAGEFISWPENPGAFALILEAAGISWTLSSELAGYDGINYGLWYDDAQFARVALLHAQAAKKLKVKKIVIGECGHAHKALTVIADRILTGDLSVPRESALVLLREIVMSGKLKLDPSRNDFPITLHDPCNMVRLMGIVEPQREILRKIAPKFREMEPHGVYNYCCGGGSGFAIMSPFNFQDWRLSVSGRMKLKQIVEAFADCPGPETPKYLCAPCSNCKGQIRDLFRYYGVWEKQRILYGGLVELIVNAMVDIKEPFIKWEFH